MASGGGSACLLETMLYSHDFHAVNEPTHTAVDLFRTMHGADPIMSYTPFVLPAFDEVKRTPQLNPKRATWLIMLRSLPPVAEYVTAHAARPERAVALCAWLEVEVERLFTGGYWAFNAPLDEFVAAAQVYYNSAG